MKPALKAYVLYGSVLIAGEGYCLFFASMCQLLKQIFQILETHQALFLRHIL
jgi:hypothetical protein